MTNDSIYLMFLDIATYAYNDILGDWRISYPQRCRCQHYANAYASTHTVSLPRIASYHPFQFQFQFRVQSERIFKVPQHRITKQTLHAQQKEALLYAYDGIPAHMHIAHDTDNGSDETHIKPDVTKRLKIKMISVCIYTRIRMARLLCAHVCAEMSLRYNTTISQSRGNEREQQKRKNRIYRRQTKKPYCNSRSS